MPADRDPAMKLRGIDGTKMLAGFLEGSLRRDADECRDWHGAEDPRCGTAAEKKNVIGGG